MPTNSCFVLWSAGIDSTYLIVRLLKQGFVVKSAYCEILNNRHKTLMEKQAVKKIAKQFNDIFPGKFEFQGTIYRASNKSEYHGGIKYRQVPYFIHALLIAPPTEYRAIAYVKGDSSIKNLDNIRQVYNSYKNITYGHFPKIIFPLKNIDKVKILQYMQKNYPEILFNCVWCAHPITIDSDNFKPCNNCVPCLRRIQEISKMT